MLKCVEAAQAVAYSLKKKKKHIWWNKLCDDAVAERLCLRKYWCANKTEVNLENLQQQRKATCKMLRTVLKDFEMVLLDKINKEFQKNNIKNITNYLSKS